MPELLPRFNAHAQRAEDERRLEEILLESDAVMAFGSSTDGHRRDRRRGLPVIGRGVAGALPGSDPLRAVIQNERQDWR